MTDRKLWGFTLVELLIVTAILLVLAGLIFAATGSAKNSARERVCTSNLHQIGLALALYRSDYDGRDPAIGAGLTYDQAGLPSLGRQNDAFVRAYVKDRRVLFCPNFKGDPSRWVSSYDWVPDEELHNRKNYRFSTVTAQRGMQTPIAICEEHNPKFDGLEARWEQKKVIVLRLDQSVSRRMVPFRSFFPTY